MNSLIRSAKGVTALLDKEHPRHLRFYRKPRTGVDISAIDETIIASYGLVDMEFDNPDQIAYDMQDLVMRRGII